MAVSPDHPELQFIQAECVTKGRPDGPPLWVVIHDMEAHETPDRAESTARYFADPGNGRNVSSHYTADDNSVVQCVLLGDVACTVGNRPGNYRGINWELAGFAAQTRQQWLDPFGIDMFDQIVPIMQKDMIKYGIPIRRCSVDDLKAFRKGVTSHNDLRLAFGGTTHTDPGPNFPWDYLFDLLQGDDMSEDNQYNADTATFNLAIMNPTYKAIQTPATTKPTVTVQNQLAQAIARIEAQLQVLEDKIDALELTGVTIEEVRDEIATSSITPSTG